MSNVWRRRGVKRMCRCRCLRHFITPLPPSLHCLNPSTVSIPPLSPSLHCLSLLFCVTLGMGQYVCPASQFILQDYSRGSAYLTYETSQPTILQSMELYVLFLTSTHLKRSGNVCFKMFPLLPVVMLSYANIPPLCASSAINKQTRD